MNVRHLPNLPVNGVYDLRRCITDARNNTGARRPDWLPADGLTSALAPAAVCTAKRSCRETRKTLELCEIGNLPVELEHFVQKVTLLGKC